MKDYYIYWAMDYCNDYWDSEEDMPKGFLYAVRELEKVDPFQFGITGQKLHDMSTTYSDNSETGVPMYILALLAPYRRLNTL